MIEEKSNIFHLKFNRYSMQQTIIKMQNSIVEKKMNLVVPVNLDMMRIAYKDLEFRNIINDSEISVIDGKPIIWFSKLYRKGFKFKISGSDLIYPVLEMCNLNNYSILIIGGKEDVGHRACQNIVSKYPNIKFVKSYSPSFGFEKNEILINETVNFINEVNADLVLLCLSAPKQEKFFYHNKDRLVKACYMCAGATVDFLAGNIKRAPKWMSKCGLEWLYRLIKEPKRLYKRYLLDFLFIPKIVFISFFRKEFK